MWDWLKQDPYHAGGRAHPRRWATWGRLVLQDKMNNRSNCEPLRLETSRQRRAVRVRRPQLRGAQCENSADRPSASVRRASQ
jgi:hypothetical protein